MVQPFARYFHRTAILEAATRVFAKRGLQSVSVQDLLQASGVSRRTFYQYFDGKEGVIEAIYEISCTILVDAIRAAARQHADPNERLEAVVDVYLSFHRNRSSGAMLRVLETEALRSEKLGPRRMEIIDMIGAELVRHLEGSGGRPDPLVVHAAVSALEAISLRVHMEGVSEASLQRAKHAMLRVLTATLAGNGVVATPLPRAR
jgi:AcrR family transcriptional regulator